jgi:hypothetical protein
MMELSHQMETLPLRPPQEATMPREIGGDINPVPLEKIKVELQQHQVLVTWLVQKSQLQISGLVKILPAQLV